MNMKIFFLTVCYCIFKANAFVFDHDVHYTSPENGDELKLRSVGRLSTVIDLDNAAIVKRVMCTKNKLMVALNDVIEAKKWKIGDLIIGSGKWKCKLNSLDSDRPGVYAKIALVSWVGPNRVDVVTSSAGPLDVFEDATIDMHYSPSEHNLEPKHGRKRRHVSNVLTNVLGTIDWNADYVSTVPFNPSKRPIVLYKRPADNDVQVLTNDIVEFMKTKEESEFYMSCLSCTGLSRISYHLTMIINKVNNKPQIVKYLSQVETKDSLHYNITVESHSEITLNHQQELWRTQPQSLAKIQLAVFKKLPPVELSIDYSSKTFLDLSAITKGAAKFHGEFDLTGKYVVSETTEQGKPSSQQSTPYDWTIKHGESQFSSNSTLNGTILIHQMLNFTASIGWSLKDIHLTSGPPVIAEIKPTMFLNATADEITHCDNSYLDVVGHFTRPADWIDVNAFGINVWHTLMSKNVDMTTPIMTKTLTSHCRANCFGQAQRNEMSEMEDICGPAKEKIIRGDRNFLNLEQLWGDFILFASEESDADWCGNEFRSCISCINRTVGEDINSKCADRMMTTNMATHITKLGRFIQAEWPSRKLIVKEAWDEPTSEYPDGLHGNTSLFYEGKAVRAGISQEIKGEFSKLVFEQKPSIMQRFGELAVCSGFGFVKSDNIAYDIDMCMSSKPIESGRRRRSTGSARDPNAADERENFDKLLSSLVAQNITREELKKYLLKPGEFYPKGRKLEEVCGPPYYKVSAETLKQVNNVYQFPLDYVQFLPEGSSSSPCSSETRSCKNSCPYVDAIEPRAWCTSRTFIAGAARRLTNLANWVTAHSAAEGEIIFLVDVSRSITSQIYNSLQSLLEKVFQKHTDLNKNPKRKVLIGVASFSNTYQTVVSKKRSISLSDIRSMTYKESNDTDIKTALSTVAREFSTTQTPKMLVLMTDGMSDDPDGVKASAASLKSKGIRILTIAAGGFIDDELLKEISSQEKTEKLYFELQSTNNIDNSILNQATAANHVKIKPSTTPNLMKDLRGIKLLAPDDGSLTSSELAALAIISGFHCVQHNTDSSVNVFVKPHDGFRSQVSVFPKVNLIMVPPPIGEETEYEYPKTLFFETRKTLLLDGFDKEAQVSDNYKIKHFLSQSKRSFRLDPTIVECLESAVDDLRANITILPGHAYRTRSANQENIGKRHKEEKDRYQAGQALGVKPAKRSNSLVDVGVSLIRSCTPLFRLQRRGIGIGCHKDFIYFDIRPAGSLNTWDLIVVWNVDNPILYKNMSDAKDAILKGGPAIIPDNPKIACAEPDFGPDLFFLTFRKDSAGFCSSSSVSKECTDTKTDREKVGNKFMKDLIFAAGTGTISQSEINTDLRQCLIDNCGGCPGSDNFEGIFQIMPNYKPKWPPLLKTEEIFGAISSETTGTMPLKLAKPGRVWDKKVEFCAKLVHKYLEKVGSAFKNLHDKTTFFNTDNTNSSMHSLACHRGNMCVENTQIYSLLLPIITAKYKPDPTLSVEELLFSPNGNPTPLPEIVEQELAYRCSGTVRVYIESERDISSLRGVLKILMVYNRQVDNVEFNIAHNVRTDNVLGTLQKKIETWATGACPQRSRLAIAPFTAKIISSGRVRRSLERSKARNDAKFRMRNWEQEWLFST